MLPANGHDFIDTNCYSATWRECYVRSGADPISVSTMGLKLASHGICKAMCPFIIIYGVES